MNELRPQDIVLLLKLLAAGSATWSFSKLGKELFMSSNQEFQSNLKAESAALPFEGEGRAL